MGLLSAIRSGYGRNGGFALIVAMLIVVVLLTMGAAFLEMGRIDAIVSIKNVQELQALAAAELGIERARAMASSQARPWSVMTYNGGSLTFRTSADPLYGGNPVCYLWSGVLSGSETGATYSVVIEDLSSFLPSSGNYRIHSFGVTGSSVRHVTIDARTLTYASFGWLTNHERSASGVRIYFADGDTIDGWVYSNDQFNIAGAPVFKGRVNSAASSIHYYRGGPPSDNPDFQQGIRLNSPPIDIAAMMNDGHITTVRDRSMDVGGIHLDANDGRPCDITFRMNGTVTIRKQVPNYDSRGRITGYHWETIINNKDLATTNGAIYSEEKVYVKGKVDGQVTIATPAGKDIVISGDLVYANPSNKKAVFDEDFDPEDPAFDDKIGLISGGDIVLDENDAADLYVMGSFAAVAGSFRNENYLRAPAKTLHLYGDWPRTAAGRSGRLAGGAIQDT